MSGLQSKTMESKRPGTFKNQKPHLILMVLETVERRALGWNLEKYQHLRDNRRYGSRVNDQWGVCGTQGKSGFQGEKLLMASAQVGQAI